LKTLRLSSVTKRSESTFAEPGTCPTRLLPKGFSVPRHQVAHRLEEKALGFGIEGYGALLGELRWRASKGPSSPSNKKVTLGYFPETIRCLSS